MKSWPRTRLLSVHLGDTLLPRVQLDVLPARGCAAHVAFSANRPARSIGSHLDTSA